MVYSIAHACSNSYVLVTSVYAIPTGAYIIHDPSGLVTRQLVAVPADVYPDGHEVDGVLIACTGGPTTTLPSISRAIADTGQHNAHKISILFIARPR